MGGAIVRLIQDTPGVVLAGATDRAGSPRLGQDAGRWRARHTWALRSSTESPLQMAKEGSSWTSRRPRRPWPT